MNKTKTDWCDSTWNLVTGCLHGCEYCYARKQALRFMGFYDIKRGENNLIPTLEKDVVRCRFDLEYPKQYKSKQGKLISASYPYGFAPTLHRYRLNDYKDKKGRTIFVCSMADLFGKWVPDEWIQEVFRACENAPQHRYLFLTKNLGRYLSFYGICESFDCAPDNWWFGVSAETANKVHCIADTFGFVKANTFLSLEPLHEDVAKFIDYDWIKWVIVGAETGNRKDKIIPKREWIENIVNECRKNNVPVFMKSNLANIWGEPLIQEYPW